MKKSFLVIFCVQILLSINFGGFGLAAEPRISSGADCLKDGRVVYICRSSSGCPSIVMNDKEMRDGACPFRAESDNNMPSCGEDFQIKMPFTAHLDPACDGICANFIDSLLTVRYTIWNMWGFMGILGYTSSDPVFENPSQENYKERIFGGMIIVYRF